MGTSRKTSFREKKYPNNLCCKLDDFRKESSFTDIVIETSERSYSVHKVLLATSSPFWRGMFANGFKEAKEPTINLKHLNSIVFEEIIAYVYTGCLHINSDTAIDMFETADFLQYDYIKKCCIQYCEGDMSSATCIQYFLLAEKYSLNGLRQTAKEFMLDNFESVYEKSSFDEFPYKTLCEILSDDELYCKSEKVVLEVISSYLKANPSLPADERKGVVDRLRFGLLESEHLAMLNTLEPYIGMLHIAGMNQTVAKYLMSKYMQPFIFDEHFKPRKPSQLLVMGGSDNFIFHANRQCNNAFDTLTIINAPPTGGKDAPYLHIDSSSPSFTRKLPDPLHSFAAVSVGNFVFVMGGKVKDVELPSRNAYRYDILTNEWLVLEKMLVERREHVAAQCGRMILVVGGIDRHVTHQNTVHSYDIANNAWSRKTDFLTHISAAAGCSGAGTVFISGGRGPSIPRYDKIYEYEPTADIWLTRGRLNVGFEGHSMCYYKSKLYAVGGADRESIYGEIQCFDLENEQCTNLTAMPYSRCFMSGVLIDKEIFIIGGWGNPDDDNDTCAIDNILVYNIEKDSWIEDQECRLPQPVNGLICVVRNNLPVRSGNIDK